MSDNRVAQKMRYRAVLLLPDGTVSDKGAQSFGADMDELKRWALQPKTEIDGAEGVLLSAPAGSCVIVYETIERAVARFDKSTNLAGETAIAESKPK